MVKDRTEGAGLENVLSPPRLESIPPPTVRLVPANELAPWLGAMIECVPSWSVETVPAMLLPPAVGGAASSVESRLERSSEVLLPLRAVVNECALSPFVSSVPM